MNALPKEWFRLALEDFKTAQVLFEEGIWNHVCFHAQQAVEKGLKAMIESKKEVPRIHDLLELASVARKSGFTVENFQEYFNYLNQFYTSTRYPFLMAMLPHGSPGRREAEQALQRLEEFLKFVKSSLQTIIRSVE